MNRAKIAIPLILLLILGIFPVQADLYDAGLCAGDRYACPEDMTQLDAYDIMIEMQPWRLELWQQAGFAAYQAEEWAQAVHFFSTAEDKGVLTRLGKQRLAEASLQVGDTAAGIETMWALMEAGHLPAQDFRVLHGLLLAELRVVEAEQVAAAWVDAEPQSALAVLSLGLVQLSRDHFEALSNLEIASMLDDGLQPFVRDLDLVIAQAHLSDDGAYQQLLIGRELANQGYTVYAEILVAQAVKLNPQYAEAWALLGELQQQNGRSDGFAALETALQLAPDSPLVQSLMAVYWQRQGDPAQALAYYQQLAAQQPEEFHWQVELAKATADNGDIPAGYDIMLAMRDAFADETQAWIALANFCAAYGMDVGTTGLDAAREALSRDEDNVDALTAMGNVLFALSDFDSAQRYYERALDAEPDNAQLHYLLGRVYLQKDNLPLARYHLDVAYQLTPAFSLLTSQIERTLEAIQP